MISTRVRSRSHHHAHQLRWQKREWACLEHYKKMRQHIKTNKKRGRPAKRKRALEYQPGEMPSPEKVSKKTRVEENDDDDIFEDAFEACL